MNCSKWLVIIKSEDIDLQKPKIYIVVYFDQQMSAWHAVCWSKLSFWHFHMIYATN